MAELPKEDILGKRGHFYLEGVNTLKRTIFNGTNGTSTSIGGTTYYNFTDGSGGTSNTVEDLPVYDYRK